jgi:hypothetical protein
MKQSVDIFNSKFDRHGSTNTFIQNKVDERHRTAIFFPIDCIPLVPKASCRNPNNDIDDSSGSISATSLDPSVDDPDPRES